MTGVQHGLPGLDALAVSVPGWLVAGVVAALVVAIVFVVVNRFRRSNSNLLWRGTLVVAGALLVWVGVDRWVVHEHAAARRALDARAAELTARALVPGSALACLDGVASASVEAACERALFAGPETIAAALAYADARLSLLADGMAVAARDPAYAQTLERARWAVEADRFGIMAQVLAMRGCDASQCPAFALLRNPARLAANLGGRTFETNVVLHAASWRSDGAALAAIPPSAPVARSTLPSAPAASVAPPPAASTPTGTPVATRYDFPSSASIPPVSIMDAEPPLPAGAGQSATPLPRPQPTPRRPAAREAAAPLAPPVPIAPPQPAPAPGASSSLR